VGKSVAIYFYEGLRKSYLFLLTVLKLLWSDDLGNGLSGDKVE
jgi:hypothetical protein